MEYPLRFEIDTRSPKARSTLVAGDLRIRGLRKIPMTVRYEKYDDHEDIVYLFGPAAAQVFIHIYPLPDGRKRFRSELSFYKQQKKRFLLKNRAKFSLELLQAAHLPDGYEHDAFQTRDGAVRRRVVHVYTWDSRGMLMVFSLNSQRFIESKFFRNVVDNLRIAEVSAAQNAT